MTHRVTCVPVPPVQPRAGPCGVGLGGRGGLMRLFSLVFLQAVRWPDLGSNPDSST